MYAELSDLHRTWRANAQADERQRLSDMAATQKRTDEANQRKILSQAAPASFDLPEGYQFGQQSTPAPDPRVGMPGKGRPATGKPVESVASPDQLPNEMGKFLRQGTMPSAAAAAPAKASRAPMWAGEDPIAQQKFDPGQQRSPIGRAPSAGEPVATPRAFDQAKFDSLMAQNDTRTPVKTPQAEYDARLAAQAPGGAATAIQRVLQREGGYVANDAGKGATNFGINSTANPEAGDVRNLTQQQAAQIYKTKYWDAIGADSLPENMREIAFDGAVNQGVPFMQQALKAAGNDPQKLIQLRAQRYQQIAQNDPSKAAFLPQWMARLQSVATGTGGTPQAPQQGAQAPQAGGQPQGAEATYTGMGPGGSPQMMQEQLRLAQFRYNQLGQMLQNAPPEQQEKIGAEMRTIHAGARAQQAYMLAAQADANPQALGQLVALSGAQAARTADGRYVFVGSDGKVLRGQDNNPMQPITAGQMGAHLFQIMDAKSREAKADMQGKIALEQAKAEAQARGKIAETGGTLMDKATMEHYQRLREQAEKPPEYSMSVSQNEPGAWVLNRSTGTPTFVPSGKSTTGTKFD